MACCKSRAKKDTKAEQGKDTLPYLYIIDGNQKLRKTLDLSKKINLSKVEIVVMVMDSVGKKKYGKEGKNGESIIKTQK
jgi:hypothetical protein